MRVLRLMMLVCVVAAPFAPASADPAPSLTFAPPFHKHRAMSAMNVSAPCAPDPAPMRARKPDASSGAVDLASSVSARACRSFSTSTSHEWLLGAAPPALAGMRARIIATVDVASAELLARGTGRRSASYSLAIGGAEPWTLASMTCSSSCRSDVTPSGVVRLERTVSRLPATLVATVHAASSIANGDGAAGASVTGTLRSVTIVPLAP